MSFLFQLICSTKCLCCNCASKHCLASSASKVTTISNTPSVRRKWSQVEENVSAWKTTLQNKFQLAICRSYKQKWVLILSCAFRTPLQAKELKNGTGEAKSSQTVLANTVFYFLLEPMTYLQWGVCILPSDLFKLLAWEKWVAFCFTLEKHFLLSPVIYKRSIKKETRKNLGSLLFRFFFSPHNSWRKNSK